MNACPRWFGAVAALAVAMLLWAHPPASAVEETVITVEPRPLPAFTDMAPEMWINSGPLTAQDFQGSVTLVDVWATSCTKCLRSMAWVHALEKRYGTQGFRVVTVHTPQYPFESNRPRIEAYAKRFQLNAPIFMDHDARYQQALEAEYWPSFYLIDHQGQIRAHFTGQMESGTRLSDAAHTVIQELLAEKT